MALSPGGSFSVNADSIRNLSESHVSSAAISSPVFISSTKSVILTTAERIALIRDALSLSMSDIATLLNTTRQSVYNWLNGSLEPNNKETSQNIQALANVAEKVKQQNIIRIDTFIHRPLFNGASLFDQLKTGEDFGKSLETIKLLSDKETSNRLTAKGFTGDKRSLKDVAKLHSVPLYKSER